MRFPFFRYTKTMKISVICPTYNRPDRHINLFKAFEHQNYQDKELLVFDDSEEASPFFSELQDPRVRYFHLPTRIALGLKRDFLIEKAQGEVIAHFDDDDYYAPLYLSTMVPHLKNCDFVKLSKWYAYRENDGTLWQWDASTLSPKQYIIAGDNTNCDVGDPTTTMTEEEKKAFIDRTLWGFGFSYVYAKSSGLACQFGEMFHGEDYNFINHLRKLGKRLMHVPDSTNLTLHFLHPESSSRIYPQHKLDSNSLEQVFGPEVRVWIKRT